MAPAFRYITGLLQVVGMSARTHRGALLGVCAMAFANIALGLVMGFGRAHSRDFETVLDWGGQWLFSGANLYTGSSATDYPPHALVLYSMLSVAPAELAFLVWCLLNVALALSAPALATRLMPSRPPAQLAGWLTVLFLCWSGAKVFGQFTLFSFVCGLLSTGGERRPAVRSSFLALALTKPQVALPFVLFQIVSREWRVLAAATGVVSSASIVYCARAAVWPTEVARNYIATLLSLHSGGDAMTGASELRPLLLAVVETSSADLISLGLSASLLVTSIALGVHMRDRRWGALTSLALGGAVPLLAVYHLTYGFVILLPAMMLLLLTEDAGTQRFRRASFAVIQLGLTFDVPGIWRRSGLAEHGPLALATAASHADRFLVLMAFVLTAIAMWRVDRASSKTGVRELFPAAV